MSGSRSQVRNYLAERFSRGRGWWLGGIVGWGEWGHCSGRDRHDPVLCKAPAGRGLLGEMGKCMACRLRPSCASALILADKWATLLRCLAQN